MIAFNKTYFVAKIKFFVKLSCNYVLERKILKYYVN